jgi:hypothetical protein
MSAAAPQRKMKLLDITKCARPVLFQNDSQEFPYSVGGTAFLVMFWGWYYAISARHVLDAGGFAPGQIRIRYRPDGALMLPVGSRFQYQVKDDTDTDQFDVVVWQVDGSVTPDQFGEYFPFDLMSFDVWPIRPAGSPYLYRGYPAGSRRINFESREYGLDSVTGEARYIDRAAYRSVHTAELLRLDNRVQRLDGLSGSSIFQVFLQEGKYSNAVLAGIFIRGSREAERVHFIEH